MTTYMGLQTLQTRDRWESEWNPADRDELKTSRMLTDVLLAATLATAAVWGVQVWKAQGSAQVQGQVDARAWHFSPACASGGCALTLTVHF